MNIPMPEKVRYIIGKISGAGFEAYAVGGCIRDSILGREPEDWDITTSARPEQIKALFPRTIDTGIQHGTVTVMLDRQGFEVTTFRIDGNYEDNRHPSEVVFTPSLTEDLRRRDFTVNAMAYNEQCGLIDTFGGLDDIKCRVIRCVGDPRERFTEDALRIMRAIRFSAQLGYEIEGDTRAAISELAANLSQISAERIQVELVKLLTSEHPDYLRMAYETGITAVILPEFDGAMETTSIVRRQNHPHHCCCVGEHILRSLMEVEGEKELRLAMLFHDIGKPVTAYPDQEGITHFGGSAGIRGSEMPSDHAQVGAEMTEKILRRLKFDNHTIHVVSKLVRYHDYGNKAEPDKRLVRRTIHKLGEDIFPQIFEVKKADIMAQSEYKRQEKLERLSRWRQIYDNIIRDQDCISLKTLAVTGKDLIASGMRPGKELGDTLNWLLEQVLEHPEYNHKDCLLSLVFREK